jgi:hypothetical protein
LQLANRHCYARAEKLRKGKVSFSIDFAWKHIQIFSFESPDAMMQQKGTNY